MTARRYAEDTRVPVEQSRAEIERTLERYGATAFAYAAERRSATVMFEAEARRVRFNIPLPEGADTRDMRERRRIYRALLLALKARLESVASGIETFEEAFLAHVVMPDGQTVGQHAAPRIAAAYQSGKMQPLLPGPRE